MPSREVAPPRVLRRTLRPGHGLHLSGTLASLAQEKRRPRRSSRVRRLRSTSPLPGIRRSRQGLNTQLYPSAVYCNPCYLTLHGIGCGVPGPLVLARPHELIGFLKNLLAGGPVFFGEDSTSIEGNCAPLGARERGRSKAMRESSPKGNAVLRPSVGDPRISSLDKKLIRKRAPRRVSLVRSCLKERRRGARRKAIW